MQEKIIQIIDISPSELKDQILNDIRIELAELSKNFKPIEPEEYITRNEAGKILKVSLKTITEYSKHGILKPYRFGSFIRFKRSELEDALTRIQNINNK